MRKVFRETRIRAAGNNEPDSGGGTTREHAGDASPPSGRGCSSLVLIETIHHNDKPACSFFRFSCRRLQKIPPCALPRPRHGWRAPASRIQRIELFDHGVEERVAV